MNPVHFSVVSALLYPFALLVAASGVALWLSQYRAYREAFLHGSRANWWRDGLVGGLTIIFVSLLSFRPMSHLVTVFGYFCGLKASVLASTALSLFMLATGWPASCVALCWFAGPLGGLLHAKGKKGRTLVALSAALWPAASWVAGWMPEVFSWHFRALPTHLLPWMVVAMCLVSSLQSWLFLWLLEYFAHRESRRLGESLWKLAALLDPVLDAVRVAPPNEELCRAMEKAVEAPCLGLKQDLQLIHRHTFPGVVLAPEAAEIFTRQEPFLVSSRWLFAVGSELLPRSTVVIPLCDGQQTSGALLLPVGHSHPLAGPDPAMRKALGALLSGALKAQRLLCQQTILDETRYRMLSAQIQPHFLFNSLTSVAALTLSAPEAAHDLIVDLAASLRPRFAPQNRWVTFAEELETVRSYLAVEKARFGDKLHVTTAIEEELLGCYLPPMLLQPLVENAVRHGFGPRSGAGQLELTVESDELEIQVRLKDDGVGFSSRESTQGHGVGLANVRARLETLFEGSHRFQVISTPQQGSEICFCLPRLTAPPPLAKQAEAATAAAPVRPTAGVSAGAAAPAARQ